MEFSGGVVNALAMVIALQASGNLVNSYVDHNYGVDTFETAGDRYLTPYCVSTFIAAPTFLGANYLDLVCNT